MGAYSKKYLITSSKYFLILCLTISLSINFMVVSLMFLLNQKMSSCKTMYATSDSSADYRGRQLSIRNHFNAVYARRSSEYSMRTRTDLDHAISKRNLWIADEELAVEINEEYDLAV